MARPKKTAPEKVVRRSKSERKGLSPELEALARGETDRLFRPRAVDPDRVRDPREGYAVKGVANRDARAVYDARIARLHAWLAEEGAGREAARARAGEELCDWTRLQLWRARRVTGLRSLCEDVLGQAEPELVALSEQAAARRGVGLEPLHERAVALWLRLEAGLLEADPTATVRLDERGRFVVSVAQDPAAAAVAAASVRLSPMARGSKRDARPAPRREGAVDAPARGVRRAGDGERSQRAGEAERRPGGQERPRRRFEPASKSGKSGGRLSPRHAKPSGGGFGARRPRKGGGKT